MRWIQKIPLFEKTANREASPKATLRCIRFSDEVQDESKSAPLSPLLMHRSSTILLYNAFNIYAECDCGENGECELDLNQILSALALMALRNEEMKAKQLATVKIECYSLQSLF
ncbi:hypothetical protein CDAR_186371 [Caerostris darwini]|uniref:Uncharacterized protein n=1 Tax=Caerostris darwini TaxID=1538125 RepID=A0AAV4W336_9ARAC|nr:hypothetical protein CDAR_186371 [Caerostris darwini]